MQAEHGLTAPPQKRALWILFRKWGFPTRKESATPIDDVVLARIRELWMRNVGQAELHRILNEEDGYNITKRALVQARKKHKMLFRSPEGDRAAEDEVIEISSGEDEDEDEASGSDSEASDVHTSNHHQPPTAQNQHQHQQHQHAHASAPAPAPLLPPLIPLSLIGAPPPEVFPTDQVDSPPPVGKGHNKPRRLTRKHGVRPRDVAAPPRFPSELTLDEAKAILGLDNQAYKAMRVIFTQLCEEAHVIKKTLAGPERWEALKDDLIRRFPPLEAELWQSRDNLDRKKLALDVICCDCTKRMRDKGNQFDLGRAKAVLGLDPYETRQARVVFYVLTERHQIRSKTDAGIKKWNEVKNEWVAVSPYLQRALAGGPSDPAHEDKLKALERLAQDVMRRRWHDESRARKKAAARSSASAGAAQSPDESVAAAAAAVAQGPGAVVAHAQAGFEVIPSPGEVASQDLGGGSSSSSSSSTGGFGGGIGRVASTLTSFGSTLPTQTTATPTASRVGATTSSLRSGEETVLDPRLRFAPAAQQPQVQRATATAPAPVPAPAPGPPSSSMAIFLRLHESSTFSTDARVWIGTMETRSVREVRRAAVERYPGAACLRVEGILKDGRGGEMPLLIEGDMELEAYLAHLNGATPTLSVQLVQGWEPAK
ncbi:hypothetical protein SODALDRAFT_331661 [Sodiomyces alkalinus F11]|uniref:Clr5 domain-containing protein n=1 Tax=Sodiomyces alkalinus (strain CBS 110278 / VKM F-3762 / F11) TaxID=1314773 RepID=A0A3N2PYP5_SODAK|nr:hypothetical protein SODALDRAFT_331661 [Sodiomyces alkalinus F11]ROT39546.1 hypothetical protein SODALDRAFT_331661 [Sodiomyces alkalinus F11]